MILTRTSPDSSQLHVLGLVVVFNVTVIRLSSLLLEFMDVVLDIRT